MTTIPPPTVPPREAPITCVQPGGGPVVALDRACGHFRRRLLRRLFPGSVSPADGVVTHVDEVEAPDFPGGRALRVSIFLSVFNVHVNRTPRSGTVTKVRYFPGEFLDARHRECSVRNEQLWIDLVDDRLGC